MTVTLRDILRAQQRLRPHLPPTPLEAAPTLGDGIWFKLEQVNPTHSFKLRGALNATLALDDAARGRGIVAASSGNHAQAVAYAAGLFDVPAKIVMPEHTPKRKVNGTRRLGGEAVLFGSHYDYAERHARELEAAEGRTFISPYNDPFVVAGAGTIGLEIMTQQPDIRRVIVPTSGGGLLAGVAVAVRAIMPDAEIVGVNTTTSPAMYNAFYGTQHPQVEKTLAEALSGEIEGDLTITLSKANVDRIVLVEEADVAAAIRWLLHEQGWLVEGGGAVGVAAVLKGLIPADGTPTAIILSGSNIDAETLRDVLAG